MLIDTLPTALQRLVRFANWQPEHLGMSSAKTFRLDGAEPFYLKINPVEPWGGLTIEAEALTWLRKHLPAPEVVFYERMDETDFLLIRALPGQPASADVWKTNPERLVETLAVTMRVLHELDPLSCPFDQRTTIKLREVARAVQLGLVDVDDFDESNSGQTPQELVNRLYASQPGQDDLVVTHGDFCLPNVILNNWILSGFIDVGRLGVGDRYQDLALCIRDLTDELNTDRYTDTFFAVYGLTTIDEEKLRYFQLLDELN